MINLINIDKEYEEHKILVEKYSTIFSELFSNGQINPVGAMGYETSSEIVQHHQHKYYQDLFRLLKHGESFGINNDDVDTNIVITQGPNNQFLSNGPIILKLGLQTFFDHYTQLSAAEKYTIALAIEDELISSNVLRSPHFIKNDETDLDAILKDVRLNFEIRKKDLPLNIDYDELLWPSEVANDAIVRILSSQLDGLIIENEKLSDQWGSVSSSIEEIPNLVKIETDKLIKSQKTQFTKAVNERAASLAEEYKTALSAISDQETETLKSQTDGIIEHLEAQTKEKIESVASGFKTEGVLKSAFQLWKDKEQLHRKMFYFGIFLFVGAITALICLAWQYETQVIKYITAVFASTVEDGATGGGTTNVTQLISRVLLITLPSIIVIWVLRTILRWANLNLALAEDAAQRSVMAQTYVNLLTNGDVTEDKDDRKVMLEAIFRPLPGIQEMDSAPPSIINFANPKAK